jgi:hypothetical protein
MGGGGARSTQDGDDSLVRSLADTLERPEIWDWYLQEGDASC